MVRRNMDVSAHDLVESGMNLLSKICIAVSATRKLNCVASGVICPSFKVLLEVPSDQQKRYM